MVSPLLCFLPGLCLIPVSLEEQDTVISAYDFGTILAADGKAIQSFATEISKNKSGNRGKIDSNWCKKEYTTTKTNVEIVTKTVRWFEMFLTVTFIVQLAYAKLKIELEKKDFKGILHKCLIAYSEIYST